MIPVLRACRAPLAARSSATWRGKARLTANADIGARFGETAPVPRATAKFYHAYQDRLLYGTDMGAGAEMYRTTFRILETEDEHFYAMDLFNYHWPLHGFGLPDAVLKKVYGDNARRMLHPARLTAP